MENYAWYQTESSVRPDEVDETTSKIYNYIRKNIVEKEAIDEDGSTRIIYIYDELKIKKEDYGMYITMEKQRADIDYISVMTGIEL